MCEAIVTLDLRLTLIGLCNTWYLYVWDYCDTWLETNPCRLLTHYTCMCESIETLDLRLTHAVTNTLYLYVWDCWDIWQANLRHRGSVPCETTNQTTLFLTESGRVLAIIFLMRSARSVLNWFSCSVKLTLYTNWEFPSHASVQLGLCAKLLVSKLARAWAPVPLLDSSTLTVL